ncbi:putative peptidoglycan glycosyltransferase FtsW [Pseudoneobacillus rhizosphaerae]|uniref:Probable peptidoglycan glycosyltransferase FtsW n=2 Tax=Pseudoneobacillus rhizosphaerae TaxID=2880968 RepID=A0A9C7G9X0_9BACI|nr:FtsW/RodA/SpoVE family cell cycle protein [Pseudoneobacillus rhizosphaerae]CAG9608659.1 putative peptidoglycan glycosyltransferase FtsW [Pseudoneobacillus rhizosphaerae]
MIFVETDNVDKVDGFMEKKKWKSYDYSLIITIVLLSLFGLVMVFSASMVSAIQWYEVESDYFFKKQRFIMITSLVIFVFFAMAPYRWWSQKFILIPIMLCSIGVLGGLLVYGHVAGNAQSWINIGPIRIQPSEFVKTIVIIYLSATYAKKQSYINDFNRAIAPPLVYLVIVLVLIIKQPDFGTAAIIGLIAMMIIFASGVSYKMIARFIGIGVIAIVLMVLFKNLFFTDEQLSRFSTRSNPFEEMQDSGYHLVNSYIAIGSGGVNGLGIGKGVQKLGYLPESHTDFIMAVIAEELGLWGVAFVILSLAFIVFRGLMIGMRSTDAFGSLMAIGISSMIGIQAFINLGGISGVIPLTGVPLPFVSYGGSSFLQLSVAVGILVNISKYAYSESINNTKESKTDISNKRSTVSNKTVPFRM